MITTKGRDLLAQIYRAHAAWTNPTIEQTVATLEALSSINRHAVSLRRVAEMQCGDGIHDGEWVNKHWDAIEAREQQLERLITKWAAELPSCIAVQIDGDPRGWIVRLLVTDATGVVRTVGID